MFLYSFRLCICDCDTLAQEALHYDYISFADEYDEIEHYNVLIFLGTILSAIDKLNF